MRQILIILLVFVGLHAADAQNMPERGEIRRGNRLFEKENYESALESYTKALTFSPGSFEANYNLSNAQHKAEQYDKAEASMAKIAADSLLSRADRADAYFNLGNSQVLQQKFKEALESYKSSMRLNPQDSMAKYNYAYTKLLLEAQPESEDQNQDQNEDQNQDQNQDQEQNQDQNQDQNEDQNQDQSEDNEQSQEQQPQEGGLSEQEQQQILDAIQAQEDKTQEKLDKEAAGVIVIPGGKNW